jgi:hypothetical protein
LIALVEAGGLNFDVVFFPVQRLLAVDEDFGPDMPGLTEGDHAGRLGNGCCTAGTVGIAEGVCFVGVKPVAGLNVDVALGWLIEERKGMPA